VLSSGPGIPVIFLSARDGSGIVSRPVLGRRRLRHHSRSAWMKGWNGYGRLLRSNRPGGHSPRARGRPG